MRKPENIHLLRRYRLIRGGGLALALFWALNFYSPGAAAVVKLSQDALLVSAAPATRSLTPIPEISVLFPIIGLVVAIALTQLLRRRRIAQQRSSLPNGTLKRAPRRP